MATIKDIANIANVSQATVSRVLKGDKTLSVGEETRQTIFSVAQDLGYTKHLKKQITAEQQPTIAIVQWYTESKELDDLYYYSIRISIEKRALEKGYQLVRTFNDIQAPILTDVDGIIAIGKFSPQQLASLSEKQTNLVFVDSDTLSQGFSCVTTDFNRSVVQVIDHFLAKDINDIGLITGEEQTTDQEIPLIDPRFRTFKQYMGDLKLYNPRNVFIGSFTSQSGYALMKDAISELGEDLPHAFFIASDALAVGALKALQEAHISVPERVSLISFNDTPLTQQVYPALSSIKVFTEEMGEQAIDLVDKMIHTKQDFHPRMIKLGTKLTLRNSSK
ncbi:LacI family DNA-binding transcriptional regulator [Streptococcus cameli]